MKVPRVQDIEQARHRRVLWNIQSGVRVRIQPKNCDFKSILTYQMDPMQSMLNQSCTELERIVLNRTSIGIQTVVIPQLDQQISCNILKSTTSISNEYSYQTDNTSLETSIISRTISENKRKKDHQTRYDRNNNAKISDTKSKSNQIEIEEFDTDKRQASFCKSIEEDISINHHCNSHVISTPTITIGRKTFFNSLWNLFSVFRLSSTDNGTIPVISDNHHNSEKNTMRTPQSRCRRSTTKFSSQTQFDNILHSEQNDKQHILQCVQLAEQNSHLKKHEKLLESSMSVKDLSKIQNSIHPELFIENNLKENADISSRNEYQTNFIHFEIKNKDLMSTRTKPNISLASISHIDDSVQNYQSSLTNELKSILPQTKKLHFNNNSFDDNVDLTTKNNPHASIISSDSQSLSADNSSKINHRLIQGQNEIIRESIDQLIRYQKYAKSYQLKSNKSIHEFLIESNALSSESLHKLSMGNEPYQNQKFQ